MTLFDLHYSVKWAEGILPFYRGETDTKQGWLSDRPQITDLGLKSSFAYKFYQQYKRDMWGKGITFLITYTRRKWLISALKQPDLQLY